MTDAVLVLVLALLKHIYRGLAALGLVLLFGGLVLLMGSYVTFGTQEYWGWLTVIIGFQMMLTVVWALVLDAVQAEAE